MKFKFKDDRHRRAYAAWVTAIVLLPGPDPDERRMAAVPNDRRTRFLRALHFLALTNGERDSKANLSKAARAAGVPRGTVASWMSRDLDFAKLVNAQIEGAANELSCLEWDPLTPKDLEALQRIQKLPEIELARIACGEVPSRKFMETAFPRGADYGATAYVSGWLASFPRYESRIDPDPQQRREASHE